MATLGNTVDGSDTSPGSGDRLFLYRVTAVEDGTITDAYCRFDATGTAGGNAKVVLYNSAAGHAGTLVAASSALSVPAGGGLVGPFTMAGSFVAGDYFIGCVLDSSNPVNRVGIDGTNSSDTEIYDVGGAYASPPDLTAATPIAEYAWAFGCAYLNYSTGGGTPGGPLGWFDTDMRIESWW